MNGKLVCTVTLNGNLIEVFYSDSIKHAKDLLLYVINNYTKKVPIQYYTRHWNLLVFQSTEADNFLVEILSETILSE